ncbi:WXG100 family type VII secretion target [Aeromicrobium chenweiae]|uniref:Uncharacterized protein n=1 Tax=Aeromicrobium chenweiae TaxID=2079793 RepID=A0A2S0WNK7_9ACTN|nr:hypothetical protein [Aeromicrobium chenweiae]AWB92915.1 hypothetical protein C3E78_12265 [Aeromicrobium chenweiae]TGN33910.1 hypothetical protein E4L97_02315 [Aeromicrobium chenweiae]
MGFGDDVVGALNQTIDGLRVVLARLENLDFWPPWDAAKTIVDAVGAAIDAATTPPEPDPVALDSAADAWNAIAIDVDRAAGDLTQSRQALTRQVWEGDAGDAARTHLRNLTDRVETVTTAAESVRRALITASDAMTDARDRHASAYSILTQHLTITWSDMAPWDLVSRLKQIVGDCVDAVRALVGSYEDAAEAMATARRQVTAAIDTIDLPTHLPDGVSPTSVVNGWEGDDTGPLRGSVLERAEKALEGMSPQQRAAAQQLLDDAGSDEAMAWILAAIASGLTGSDLDAYAAQLATMTPDQMAALDPTTADDGTYTQPDQTTCGSATLVMSKMLNDPAYAMYIATGRHPVTGQTSPLSPSELFDAESLAMHQQTNAFRDHAGNPQVPWIDEIGTSPWGVAHQMAGEGGSGIPGSDYGLDLTDPSRPGADYDHIVAATEDGQTVPLYVGDDKSPRHVVLVTSSSDDTLTIYEPSAGRTITVTRDEFERGDVDVAGWDKPWLAVTPS